MPDHRYSAAEIAAVLAEACLHAGIIEVDGLICESRPGWTREAIDILSRQGWIKGTDGFPSPNWQSNEGDLIFDLASWRSVLLPLKARLGHPLEA